MIGNDILEGLIFNVTSKFCAESLSLILRMLKAICFNDTTSGRQHLLCIFQTFSFNNPMETLGGHSIKLIKFINSENLKLFEM